MSAPASAWREHAVRAGERMARTLLANRGSAGRARCEAHLSEPELTAMLAAAFEIGAELATDTERRRRSRLVRPAAADGDRA